MAVERIKYLMQCERLSIDDLVIRTGISYNRWANVLANKVKLRHEEVEALGSAFPEYRFWLAFCEDLPRCGQISPRPK